MFRSRIIAVSVALAFLTLVADGQTTATRAEAAIPFSVAPQPAWVKEVTASADEKPGQESTGSYYMLIDRQISVGMSSFYWHEIRKITSENGVQAGASVSFSFDPSFERLTLHSLRVIRNGIASDRLDRSQLQFTLAEQDPQRLAYNASVKAQTTLEDVRVGDVIEVAYTTEGINPSRQGKYSDNMAMQWGVPVGRNVMRVIYPSSRKLAFRLRNDSTKPTISEKMRVPSGYTTRQMFPP